MKSFIDFINEERIDELSSQTYRNAAIKAKYRGDVDRYNKFRDAAASTLQDEIDSENVYVDERRAMLTKCINELLPKVIKYVNDNKDSIYKNNDNQVVLSIGDDFEIVLYGNDVNLNTGTIRKNAKASNSATIFEIAVNSKYGPRFAVTVNYANYNVELLFDYYTKKHIPTSDSKELPSSASNMISTIEDWLKDNF